MTIATLAPLAAALGVDEQLLREQYPGTVALPSGLFRPLAKDERGAVISSTQHSAAPACLSVYLPLPLPACLLACIACLHGDV